MARNIDNDKMVFSAGDIAGIQDWGSIAVLIKRDWAGGGSWHCPIYSGDGGSGDWGMSLDITDTNILWFGLSDEGQAYGSFALNSTSVWYFIMVTKASGTATPVAHYRVQTSGTWGTWTHQNMSATVANGNSPTTDEIVLGGFSTTFDQFEGTIAAAAIYLHWAPSNATIEGIGFTTGAQEWVDAAANASAAWVAIPGQTAINVAIQDQIGSGHETSTNQGSVVSGPTGWDETLGGTPVELQSTIAISSSMSGTLRNEKRLSSTIAVSSSMTGTLRSVKELESTIAASSGLTADLQLRNHLVSTIALSNGFDANLRADKYLSSTIAAQSSTVAGLTAEVILESMIAITSTFVGELFEPLPIELEASSDSALIVAAELYLEKRLESSAGAQTDFTADLQLQNALESAISSSSDFTGDLRVDRHLESTISNALSVLAAMEAVIYLDSDITSTSGFDGNLTVEKSMATQSDISLSMSGTLRVDKRLESSISIQSNLTGSLNLGEPVDEYDEWLDYIIWARRRWFQPVS